MPTSAAGIWKAELPGASPAAARGSGEAVRRHAARRGFTLIEVLVVSLLIAIIAGAVFFSFDLTERSQVRNVADRLQHVLRNLGNEAVLSGRICGVLWNDTSVEPQCRTSHGEVENMEDLLGGLGWGRKMNLALLGENGEVLRPKSREEMEREAEEEEPDPDKFYDIQIWPTGLWEPAGSVVFKSASNKIAYLLLSWTASGRMSLEKVEDQSEYIAEDLQEEHY